MRDWQNNVQNLRTFIQTRCSVISSGIVDCYPVTGPFPITVIVDPPLSGNEVKVNSITPSSFPFVGNYFGDVTIDLDARAANNWNFERWEIVNHTLSPALTDEFVTLNLTTSDTIIAYFNQGAVINLPSYDLTVNIIPPLSGEVEIEAFTPSAYPWTGPFTSGENLELSAHPAADYFFDYWELENQTVNPNVSDDSVSFAISENDVVTAHFQKTSTAINSIENLRNNLNVFPTLVSDILHVEIIIDFPATLSAELLSIDGRLITKFSEFENRDFAKGEYQFQISLKEESLESGVYFFLFKIDGLQFNSRIVFSP